MKPRITLGSWGQTQLSKASLLYEIVRDMLEAWPLLWHSLNSLYVPQCKHTFSNIFVIWTEFFRMMNKSIDGFQILAFSSDGLRQPLLFIAFFAVYIIGVLGNLVILIVIVIDRHLHTPMYFFLSNLSSVDICYMNITLPKRMYILLSGDNSISFMLYFYNFIGTLRLFCC